MKGFGYALLKPDIFDHLIPCFYIRYFIGALNLSKPGLNLITIVGLKPETTYEVKISAINGKGEGESSPPESFKTQPVRKCLSLSVFLSLSVPLYHMTLALSLPINPPSSAQQQTSLPTMHPCLGPCWISLPGDALLVLCVCFCIYMWMCVHLYVSVCLNNFPKAIVSLQPLTSAVLPSDVALLPVLTSLLPVPACARQQLCLVSTESCVCSVKCRPC